VTENRRAVPALPPRAIALAACLLCAACEPKLTNPTAPETEGIEASYNSPTGTVAANFRQLQEMLEQQNHVIEATDGLEVVESLFDDVSQNERVAPSGDQADPTAGARLLAVARITHICRGPVGDDVIDAKKHGQVTMTIKGSPRGIFPIVWGRFDACVDHSSAGPFTIDGEYSLTLRNVGKNRTLLFVFDGSVEVNGETIDIAFDFRVRNNGAPELRVSSDEGDVILTPTADAKLEVRDSEGSWLCDPVELTCTNEETGEVREAETDEE
jgi:hypothetical protein